MKDDVIFCILFVWNKFPYAESLVIHRGFLPYGIWCMDRKPGPWIDIVVKSHNLYTTKDMCGDDSTCFISLMARFNSILISK